MLYGQPFDNYFVELCVILLDSRFECLLGLLFLHVVTCLYSN
jgi:hypothetical protein